MRRVPEQFVEELRSHVDIVEVVSDHVQLKRSGRSYVGLCPFHNERTPSFSVSPDRQMYHCFGCGAGGTVVRFVMDAEGLSFVEAVTKLAERANLQLPFRLEEETEPASKDVRFQQMKDAHELAAKLYNYILMNTAAGVQALKYLEDRGVSRQTIVDFKLGFAPTNGTTLISFLRRRNFDEEILSESGLGVVVGERLVDRFRGRVMIPILDGQGHVVSFGGRILQPKGTPKYLNSPETPLFHKSSVLFNLNLARKEIRKTRIAVLFEGYMDVISAWQAGVKNGVASMGTSLTSEQASLLKRYADQLIVAYDGDAAGIRAARRALEIARELSISVRIAEFPDGADPDDFIALHGAEAFKRQLLNRSLSEIQFLIKDVRRSSQLESTAARTEFMRRVLKVLGERATPIEQETELRKLSQEFQVSVETLKEELALVSKQEIKQKKRVYEAFRQSSGKPSFVLAKANVTASNRLLQAAMTDEACFDLLLQRGIEELALPEQTALLALLYDFKSYQPESSVQAFMESLTDPQLVRLASSLLVEAPPEFDLTVCDDYLRTIRLHQMEDDYKQLLEQLVEAQVSGDGDVVTALKMELDKLQVSISEMKSPRPKG